ncbi:aspartate--tRNA ligase [Anaerotignum sp. MB30-C6]|uniref:aspartate--tRNA ligase n=1 Tax=Anaerotignum sp. MB30-C6 TaxID=3070814 RepID=UPI0027DCFD36|nr:aspartate--tRNA ligase [Anaerotignum sp. MB30-C6]WMI80504.1 aspartate--tRNA ligase [Anaerotignum sp. MB30-C6]
MGEALTGLKRSCMCCDVNESMIGKEVTVMGWVQRRRDLGQLIFIALRDRTGLVQVAIDGNVQEKELFAKAESVRSEFVLAVKGQVAHRTEGNINPNMKTGTIEIIASEIRILSESETTPFQIEDNITVKDDLRLKYRYLDLRRPSQLNNLILRHKVVQVMRNFLDQEAFLEIETPILGKSTPEGARDYLVPSRVHPGNFYGLPQSPQLYKQLLMVSGMDRYYQVAKCFRDEDLRADRQPEFTQVDMELSFVDVEDIMDINERMMQKVFKDILNVEISLPLKRMTYEEAMERFGSDKPDVRFGMELVNISEAVTGTDFVVFKTALEAGGSVRAINAKGCGSFPRKKIDSLVEFVKTYRAKGLAWIVVNEDGSLKSQIAKFFTEEKLQEIVDKMDGKPGDLILICADQDKVVFDSLGALRLELSKMLELTKADDFSFLWITEFPMLEWDEEAGRFVAVHHPFTAPMDEDLPLLETEPGKVRAKAYDIVLNGYELGGGSIRIHRRDIQQKMFELLGFSQEDAQERFGFLLDAFKYGVPPHGGLAFGLDRIIMLMCGATSIRDVMAFPKVKDASCPMTDAPNVVDEKQLDELAIIINKEMMKGEEAGE